MLADTHERVRGYGVREDHKKGPAHRDARDESRRSASETERIGREQQRRATAYGRARGQL
ncbi:hypothetical protein B5F74_09560 [Collinsella sp. An271]|nr:hypothetical protein B5F74_09560 [Collinsella sp. An271]